MSRTVSNADPSSPEKAAAEDAPAQDGWRHAGLAGLRAELDRIDDAIHDLLMQRAEVVEHVGRSGKPAALRPGREASMIRRLLGRHQGALPAVTLVRLWREMLAGTTAMQGGFSLAVADTGMTTQVGEAALSQLAREHFGALTPLRMGRTPAEALADVTENRASVAVLPIPSETDGWWVSLIDHLPRLHIIARLPFWAPRPKGLAPVQAVVVGATPADPSQEDRSFLALACPLDAGCTRLPEALTGAGLTPASRITWSPADAPGGASAGLRHVLVEVGGYLTDDDPRLSRLTGDGARAMVLGHYAIPVGGEQ